MTSTLSTLQLITTAAAALVTGIVIGSQLIKPCGSSRDVSVANHDDADLDDLDALPTKTIDATQYDDYKMVLVVRTDLGMTKGKIAAQCGHATLSCYKAAQKTHPKVLGKWEREGQAKVALKAESEEQLLELKEIALRKGLTAQSIRDAGRTQIKSGSLTVLGIGPGPVELINEVTGALKLL